MKFTEFILYLLRVHVCVSHSNTSIFTFGLTNGQSMRVSDRFHFNEHLVIEFNKRNARVCCRFTRFGPDVSFGVR